MYVTTKKGIRIKCPHPCEMSTVIDILGGEATEDLIYRRTGFNSHCICLDCLTTFEADLGDEENNWRRFYGYLRPKDKRICPKCNSLNIKTAYEMIDEPCPKCNKARILCLSTGLVS